MQEIRGNAVNIAKQLQRPRRMDDEDGENENVEETDEEEGISRRQTIFKLHENREKHQQDYSDLVRNFETRYYGEGKQRFIE